MGGRWEEGRGTKSVVCDGRRFDLLFTWHEMLFTQKKQDMHSEEQRNQTEQSSVGRSDEANKFPHGDGENNERDDVFHSPIGCQLGGDPATIVPSLDFRNEVVEAFNKICSRRQNVYNKAGY